MQKVLIAILVIIFALLAVPPVNSFDTETHRELSEQGVRPASTLDEFLKTQLNLSGGVEEQLANKKIIDWIADGSISEDDGLRFLNHFHNPLRTWNQAGLLGSTLGTSSIIWGQDLGQGFSWQFARDEYFKGLTATTKEEREDHLANTFRALGQLIHLVQDAGQPAHTRDDPHPIARGFEGFVEDVRLNNPALFDSWISSSLGFDQTILTLTPNPLAPIPISRIIDTTDPEAASAIPSAGTNQGIAEYSNANFLSWDTIFKDFVFPRVESLGEPFDGAEPVTGKPRRYFPKVADGDTGYRLVAEGTFSETLVSLSAGDQGYILDRGVFEDYAARLLRRTIGYSAGLIDYFFRGGIDALIHTPFLSGTQLSGIIFGTLPTNEAGGTGIIALVLGFQPINSNEILYFASAPQNVTLGPDQEQDVTFDFSNDPIPPDIVDGTFQGRLVHANVVYKGRFGLEEEAVLTGFPVFCCN